MYEETSSVTTEKALEPIEANVDLVRLGDKLVYLVGTAHVSKKSAELAERIIKDIKPDSVAVELCDSRFQALQDPDRWKNTDIVKVIRSGRAYLLMAQLLLAGFQKKIGEKLEVKPGLEMLLSINAAKEVNAQTVLADRDIRTTLKRTWSALSLWSASKLITAMISSLFVAEEISEEEVERLKSLDALEVMMKELSDAIPEVRQTLIDERDQYLAAKIQEAPGKSVVAILGAGHIPGVKKLLGTKIDIAPLEVIPPKGLVSKLIGWSIPIIFIGMIVGGFFTAGSGASIEMVKTWIVVTGTFASIGALLAFSHPLTVVSAFVGAPFATINPFIAAGWISGLVEAMIRKPRVADLEHIADDVTTLRGFWKNRVSKILLVVAFTNLGAMAGMFIGIPMVASYL